MISLALSSLQEAKLPSGVSILAPLLFLLHHFAEYGNDTLSDDIHIWVEPVDGSKFPTDKYHGRHCPAGNLTQSIQQVPLHRFGSWDLKVEVSFSSRLE